MRTIKLRFTQGSLPLCVFRLYEDDNGNWFCSCDKRPLVGMEPYVSDTYTVPKEALADALNKMLKKLNADI